MCERRGASLSVRHALKQLPGKADHTTGKLEVEQMRLKFRSGPAGSGDQRIERGRIETERLENHISSADFSLG
jgi:hypothetical protein